MIDHGQMKRKGIESLRQWFSGEHRLPLVLRGARQVGKTWLVREFANTMGLRLLEVNFERVEGETKSLFRHKDPRMVVRGLELLTGQAIEPRRSLLFLDEVQAMPEVFANLRWFAEEYGELPVVAAGSLLDMVLADHAFSMPVGRIEYLHVEPMAFEEFLEATGQDMLLRELEQWTPSAPWHEMAHMRLSKAYRDYLVVGGMPRVVQCWVDRGSVLECSNLQQSLLATYRDDFSKYAGRQPVDRIGRVMESVPRMLGQPFKYARVADGESGSAIRQSFDLLCRARLATRVHACAGNGIPLGAEVRERVFKAIFLDSGLVCAALGLALQRVGDLQDLVLVNEGGLAEQSAGQALRALLSDSSERSLYYWSSASAGSNAELDYLVQHGRRIVPVEVKAGTTGSLKSLHHFMALRGLDLALRVNADVPSVTPVNLKTTEGVSVSYRLLSIPFCLMGQMHRLLTAMTDE